MLIYIGISIYCLHFPNRCVIIPNMNYKFATTTIFSLIALLVLVTSGVHSSFASVSSYTASDFSQFCANHSSTCSKNEHPGSRSGSVSCPSSDQTIDSVYVHAGNG